MQTWIRRCSTLATIALAASAAAAAPASAQSVSYGILAGASFSDMMSTDFSATTSAGFAGGLYAGIPLGKSFTLEPELLYTNKGANVEGASATVNLNYIEIPVLARYNFTTDGGPFAYAGPYVGFNMNCNTTTTLATTNCSDASVNANTVFGGALGVGFQKSAWGFDLRYEYDFTDAVDAGPGKNSAFMALLRLAVK
jgi:hypothetical protein